MTKTLPVATEAVGVEPSESISKDDHIAAVEAIRAEYLGRFLGAKKAIDDLVAIHADLVKALEPFANIDVSATFRGVIPGALIKTVDVHRARDALARSKAQGGE